MATEAGAFTEKDFYLAEFRGRSLGLALPAATAPDVEALAPVLQDLLGNGTRVVLFTPSRAAIAGLVPETQGSEALAADGDPAWVGRLWRRLARDGRAGLELAADGFARRCSEAAVRLRLAKLVWIDARGALVDAEGRRISAIALPDLEARLGEFARAAGDTIPLSEIRQMLASGVASVSVCRLDALADELFTYAGSGTFFSRERYADVRRLTLDDFDAAAYLLGQGVAEGYLTARSAAEIESVLSHGFGVFIEGRYLAGIGALRPYEDSGLGEIVGLYTVTRFAGEGVGGHLIRFALSCAREAGLARVFACTTSERVEGFFLRHDFERIDPADVPPSKWNGYPEQRRAALRCLGRKVD